MRRLYFLITFIQVFCLSINLIQAKEVNDSHLDVDIAEGKQSLSFQFPPPHSTLQKYPLVEEKKDDSDFLVSSIRRFPQYPSSSQYYPINSDGALVQRQPQVISVLSGAGSPHQSVSWNPPATSAPPSLRGPLSFNGRSEASIHRDSSDNSRFFQPVAVHPNGFSSNAKPDSNHFLPTGSIVSPSSFKPLVSVDGHNLESSRSVLSNGPSSRVISSSSSSLSSGPIVLTSPSSSSSTTSNLTVVSGSSTPNKKDDVVIYYYYYYDDEDGKNSTVKVTSNRDFETIPSLEQFDPPEIKKPEIIHPVNDRNVNKPVDTSKDDEVVAPFRGFINHFDHMSGLSNAPTRPTTVAPFFPSVVNHFNQYQNRPASSPKPTQVTSPPPPKSSTDVSISVSVSGDGSVDPVSNVFRYESSVGPRPTFDSVRVGPFSGVGARGTAFQPQFPGQGFRHIPSASTPSSFYYSFSSPDVSSSFSYSTQSPDNQNFNKPIFHQGHIQPMSKPTHSSIEGNLNNVEIKLKKEALSATPVSSTLSSTTFAATFSPTTTTPSITPALTTTTVTTTPLPTTLLATNEETTTAPRGRSNFGSRRRFGSANRPNPLNRFRSASSSAPRYGSSSTTTTTTTTSTTTPRSRNRSFGNSLRRPNRPYTPISNRKKLEDEKKETETVSKFITYSTTSPNSSFASTTSAPKRFGSVNRGRYGTTSRSSSSKPVSSFLTSSTASFVTSSTSTISSTSASIPAGARTPVRRPSSFLTNRGRQRPSFFRSRNKPAEETTELPKSSETETEASSLDSSAVSSSSSSFLISSTESMTSESASSSPQNKLEMSEEVKTSSESPAPVSSTTEKSLFNRPRNRNPLFRNRPRPNIFGSRRTNLE